jgi:anti-sigma regulatory factor (Ser/Thr protein kinase)
VATMSHRDDHRTMPDDAVLLFECDFDREHLGPLRGELGKQASAHGLADRTQFNFVLAVNEITTNTLQHARCPGHLRLWRHAGSLWCEVTDDGPGIPRRYLDAPHARTAGTLGGHGLWLARRLCDGVHIETGRRAGTRVLLRFAVPPAGR